MCSSTDRRWPTMAAHRTRAARRDRASRFLGARGPVHLALAVLIAALSLLGSVTAGRAADGAAAPDELHLSWVGDPSTTMAVTWRTATDSAGPYVIQWGPTPGVYSGGDVAATSEPAPGGRGFLHKAEVTGLQPDTEYSYRVAGDNGAWSTEYSFRTAPGTLSDRGITFTVNGDVGTSYMFADVAPIMHRLAAEPPGPHLVVGDLTYADLYRGTEEEEHWLATDLAVVARRRPVLVTWGNHEYYRAADAGIETITQYFQLPRTGWPNACNPTPFYSLRYAGVLLVALDDPASPCFDRAGQQAWLGQTLAAAAADAAVVWKVVLVHSPPFSSGCHGSEALNRYPEFDRYGVDLVISGHDHDYERSWPTSWDGSAIGSDYAAPRYPTYLVAGVGGAATYDCVSSKPWSAFFDPGRHVGYVRVTAFPTQLVAELVAKEAYVDTSELAVFDRFVVMR